MPVSLCVLRVLLLPFIALSLNAPIDRIARAISSRALSYLSSFSLAESELKPGILLRISRAILSFREIIFPLALFVKWGEAKREELADRDFWDCREKVDLIKLNV